MPHHHTVVFVQLGFVGSRPLGVHLRDQDICQSCHLVELVAVEVLLQALEVDDVSLVVRDDLGFDFACLRVGERDFLLRDLDSSDRSRVVNLQYVVLHGDLDVADEGADHVGDDRVEATDEAAGRARAALGVDHGALVPDAEVLEGHDGPEHRPLAGVALHVLVDADGFDAS